MSIARVNTDYLTGAADAIRRKTDSQNPIPLTQFENEIDNIPTATLTTKTITQNGTYNASSDNADGYDVVTVDVSPLIVKEKTVNFYNYTGELVHSYTADEIAKLTELPEAPTVQGMTFQEWNWSLADIKTWALANNGEYDYLAVGAIFITTDGHTRIYMTLRDENAAMIEMPFCIKRMSGTVDIDWGDGVTETINSAGNYSHLWQIQNYPANVVIDLTYHSQGGTKLILGKGIDVNTYKGLFNGNEYYASCVTSVKNGGEIEYDSYCATFMNCTQLKTINLPKSISSLSSYLFTDCVNLSSIVIPNGIANISTCAFRNCKELTTICLPASAHNFYTGAFSGCTSLKKIFLYNPDIIYHELFDGCTSLIMVKGLRIVNTSLLKGCSSLSGIEIPSSTSKIHNQTFNGCHSLLSVKIPYNCKIIESYAFSSCSCLYFFDLTEFTDPSDIPVLNNANAFSGIPATAQFIVANQEMYDAFTTATNWSTYASKFVIEGA